MALGVGSQSILIKLGKLNFMILNESATFRLLFILNYISYIGLHVDQIILTGVQRPLFNLLSVS